MLKQKIIYQLDAGAYKPVKAHETDATTASEWQLLQV